MCSHSGCTAPCVWCGEYVYSIWTDWAFGCQKPLSVTLCYDDWSNNNLWWAPSSSAVNLTLIAFAAECWHLQHDAHSASAGIDQYLLPAWCSAANLPATVAVAAVDRWDRQMYTRPLHRPCSTYYAGSQHCDTVCWVYRFFIRVCTLLLLSSALHIADIVVYCAIPV